MTPNKVFNLTYLGVTDLAFASSAPPKTQVKTALDLQAIGNECEKVTEQENAHRNPVRTSSKKLAL